MKQCPDCEAKDRVMIAGKVFCANCGTPWQPADPKELESYLSANKTQEEQGQAVSQPPQATITPSPPAPQPAQTTATTPPVMPNPLASQASLEDTPGFTAQQPPPIPAAPEVAPSSAKADRPITPSPINSPLETPLSPPAAPSNASVATTASQVHLQKTQSPVPAEAPGIPANNAAPVQTPLEKPADVNIRKTADRLASAQQIPKNSSIDKFHRPQVTPNNQASALSASQPPPVATQDVQSQTAASVDQGLTEHVGSEMPELNIKDEPLLTDRQFSQLEEIRKEQPQTEPPPDDITASDQPIETAAISTPPPVQAQETRAQAPPAKVESVLQPPPAYPIAPTQGPAPSMTDISMPVNPNLSSQKTVGELVANQPSANQPAKVLNLPGQSQPTPPAFFKPTDGVSPATNQPNAQDTTTVAGLTMSKEAAMKLALDTKVDEPTGEASIGKAFKPGSVALTIVGLLLISAYIWQINYPNLALKVASNRAGVTVGLPNYLPGGWKLTGHIQSKPGLISYNLADTKKDHELSVTATKTDWDSQALADNYIVARSDNYLALQAQGLTIYLYGDNQASWINGEKWYRLEGDGHGLSQDQIIKMATSL